MASKDIDIPSRVKQFPGELHSPAGKASGGLVVIVYGTEGFADTRHGKWQEMMRGYAGELAAQGLFALIPLYFRATDTPDGDLAAAGAQIQARREDWSTALLDAVAHARTLPGVDPSRVGLLGFSLGGYLCLRVRAAAKPKALVAYFAPTFDDFARSAKGSVPHVQIHHGTGEAPDGPTRFANAAAIKAVLDAEGPDVTVFPYKDATHGFAGPTKADADAAAESKRLTVEFFSKWLS